MLHYMIRGEFNSSLSSLWLTSNCNHPIFSSIIWRLKDSGNTACIYRAQWHLHRITSPKPPSAPVSPLFAIAKLWLFATQTWIIWYNRVWPCLLGWYPGAPAWQLLAHTRKAGKGLDTWDVVGSVAWQQVVHSSHALPLGIRERVTHASTPWQCFMSLYCS